MTPVLSIAEHRRGSLRDISFELITAGRRLADDIEGGLHMAVIGGDIESFARSLEREGIDVIHTVDEGDEFNHDVMVQAVVDLVNSLKPEVLLLPNSVNGLDYAPAVADALDRPLVTDAIKLEVDDGLLITREMYGSKVATTVKANFPAIVSIRGTEWPPQKATGKAEIKPFEVDIDEGAVKSTVTGFEDVTSSDVDITEADVLVSIGRGIGDEDNLELIFNLAEALGATVSSSRPIVDAGWLEKSRQVGQSGKTVTPDIYLAIGISGAVQHVAGMKGAETIIAINNDPTAPIFDLADYGVIGDLFEVVPLLIEEFS